MDDLPELPFEKVLSYLSLEDRLKARVVSRRWYHTINSFKVKSLCYSELPSGFIWRKRRLVCGAFTENFISCTRFASFFNAVRESMLSNLKHLRLCDLRLSEENRAAFGPTLQAFGQLEELDIIRFGYPRGSDPKMKLELNMPVLHSIRLEGVDGIQSLRLGAPKLKNVKLSRCYSTLKLYIVHVELFERLVIDHLRHITVKSMKYLKYLYTCDYSKIDSTLLSSLEQLKEIHLDHLSQAEIISEIFEQKQRSGRTELRVFLHGLLLNGPDDPAIDSLLLSLSNFKRAFRCLAENPSRLADEIPFNQYLSYDEIQAVAPGSEMNVLKRLTDSDKIRVHDQVQDIERFLDILRTLDAPQLSFSPQPQELFDRLPEGCAVQRLLLGRTVSRPCSISDFGFLFRLKNLNELYLSCSIDAETVRRLFEELPHLSKFFFKCKNKNFEIETDHSKRFEVTFGGKKTGAADLNSAVQLVIENTPQRKRKVKVLSE